MDASEEKQAFARGIADFCARNGTPEFAVPLAKFAEHSDAFALDPGAFAAGFDGFIKRAYPEERKSFLRRILPWILIPAGLYGAARLGDMWGRHAYANNNDNGPIFGPIAEALSSATGQDMHYVGRRNAKAIRSDWKSRPMTADQLERLHRTGSSAPLD